MPFLQSDNNKDHKKINSTKNSLRTYLKLLFQKRLIKRASSFTSRKLYASMTVEAAFALPLFMFFIIQIMSAINMIGIQSRIEAALHQTGNEMAFSGYLYEKAAGILSVEGLSSALISNVYAESQVIKAAGKTCLDRSCIKNGAAGISFKNSSIMGSNDIIEIGVSYYVQPVVQILGFDGFKVYQRYYGRAWTGYDVSSTVSNMADNDPMVYITETGTVYHTNRNCTYLNPAITSVNADGLNDKRNLAGGKYYPCEKCGKNAVPEIVYITNQGSSYHTSVTCSGLKRTVYTVPLSEAGGRGRCSKCK